MSTLVTKLTSIFSLEYLADAKAEGLVRERAHPEFPELRILNYTEKAAFADEWNTVTLACRGLIYNADTLEVLARPFAKFFNYGQKGAPEIDLDARIYAVGDKADGSLGIFYWRPDGKPAFATRGSFESDQAIFATEFVQSMSFNIYAWLSNDGLCTPLVEIVYPENRIVVDYGDFSGLIPLGSVWITDGAFVRPAGDGWFNYTTMREVLAQADRPNKEGYVVWLDQHTAVKIKQEDYIELHRIVTGLNRKSVWRAVSESPRAFKNLLEQLPDELYEWASAVGSELYREFAAEVVEIDKHYQSVLTESYDYPATEEWDAHRAFRADFAKRVKRKVPTSYAGYMFALLDGKNIQEKVWRSIEPVGGER